jgi:hypothetical protein
MYVYSLASALSRRCSARYDPRVMSRRIVSLVVLLSVLPALAAEVKGPRKPAQPITPEVLWQFESGG